MSPHLENHQYWQYLPQRLNSEVSWCLTALSAQTGYIVLVRFRVRVLVRLIFSSLVFGKFSIDFGFS